MSARRSWKWLGLGWTLGLTLLAATGPAPGQPALDRALVWNEVVNLPDEHTLGRPADVAAGSTTELVVADLIGPRLVVFRNEDRGWLVRQTIPLDSAPYAIAHDGTRYLVSLREARGLIALSGDDQLQIRRIALPEGAVAGALSAIPGGGFLVVDMSQWRVFKLDTGGNVVRETAVGEPMTAIAAAADGGFLATVAAKGEVISFSAAGLLTDRWEVPGVRPVPAWPSSILALPGGDLLIVDRHGGRLLVTDGSGRAEGVGSRKGWEPGLLRFPAGACRLPDGRIAVADQGNGRVQIFGTR